MNDAVDFMIDIKPLFIVGRNEVPRYLNFAQAADRG
jgi:hypothetical protein